MYESKIKSEECDRLYEAILTLKTKEDCYRFFDDLCTINEVISMAQRFQVVKLLQDGMTFAQISADTGVSSATITRVNKCLSYGSDGYRMVLDRLEEQKK